MSTLMNTLLQDQRRIEDRRTPPAVPVTRAERIIAAGHAQRTAYRQRFPDADTAMVYGEQIGYLHGEVKRLCNEAEAMTIERDKDLEYIEVTHPDIASDVTVGVTYEPGSPARITSARYFSETGDPGDPGEPEYIEVNEVWVNGVEIAAVLNQHVLDQLSDYALEKIHAIQAKAREGDV